MANSPTADVIWQNESPFSACGSTQAILAWTHGENAFSRMASATTQGANHNYQAWCDCEQGYPMMFNFFSLSLTTTSSVPLARSTAASLSTFFSHWQCRSLHQISQHGLSPGSLEWTGGQLDLCFALLGTHQCQLAEKTGSCRISLGHCLLMHMNPAEHSNTTCTCT